MKKRDDANPHPYSEYMALRSNKKCRPKYKILSREFHRDRKPTLTLHTAGDNYVWKIAVQDAIKNGDLLANMDAIDRDIVHYEYAANEST